MFPHSGYAQETVYLAFFGLGTFNIEPHIVHCTVRVSGALLSGLSVRVRPTSVDHPSESV